MGIKSRSQTWYWNLKYKPSTVAWKTLRKGNADVALGVISVCYFSLKLLVFNKWFSGLVNKEHSFSEGGLVHEGKAQAYYFYYI